MCTAICTLHSQFNRCMHTENSMVKMMLIPLPHTPHNTGSDTELYVILTHFQLNFRIRVESSQAKPCQAKSNQTIHAHFPLDENVKQHIYNNEMEHIGHGLLAHGSSSSSMCVCLLNLNYTDYYILLSASHIRIWSIILPYLPISKLFG